MAHSREIIKKVLQYVRFRVPQTEEKNSYYTEIGNTLVRLSNHCTRLRVWDEILEKNPKWKGKPIISIVFEDDEDTFDEVDCLVLKRVRMKPIKVTEYVYRLQGDPQFITPQDERLIISGIKQVQGGKYTDLTNKCSEPTLRISQNPPDVPPTKTMNNNENKQYNKNTNMNKKLIRLTESDLHKIVKESVNKVLTELDWKTYANAAKKQMEKERNQPDYDEHYDGQYQSERTDSFKNAARKAFGRKHEMPYTLSKDWNHEDGENRYGRNMTLGTFLDSHDNESDYYINGLNNNNGSDYVYEPKFNYDNSGDRIPQHAKDDLKNYMSGKSKYIKGRGWQ